MNLKPSRYALIAGVSVLLIAVVAPYAIFGILASMIDRGDAAVTQQNIAQSLGSAHFAVLLLFLAALLDVVIGWALWRLFQPVSRSLSLGAGAMRGLYALGFILAIERLHQAISLATASQPAVDQVLVSAKGFYRLWDLALILFAVHLFLLGWIFAKIRHDRNFIAVILSLLLFVAGLGYLADSLARLFFAGRDFNFSAYTFGGEILLMIWLLYNGARGTIFKP